MKVALLLGSFNPIHRAHTAIANWALERDLCDNVWIVPTPQNPLKTTDELASWNDRLAMIELAIKDCKNMELCLIENSLPSPHYTIHTIEQLKVQYPDYEFTILCGSDIIEQLPKWHKVEQLRTMVDFIQYPRGINGSEFEQYVESSTNIRQGDMKNGLDDSILAYIEQHELYFASALNRAKRAWSESNFPEVINLAATHPENDQIEKMAQMARQILDFRHTDIYNP